MADVVTIEVMIIIDVDRFGFDKVGADSGIIAGSFTWVGSGFDMGGLGFRVGMNGNAGILKFFAARTTDIDATFGVDFATANWFGRTFLSIVFVNMYVILIWA